MTESPFFVVKYRDGSGVVRVESTRCRDETAARQILAELERRAELVRSGVITAGEESAVVHRTTPMEQHREAYLENMRGRALSQTHRKKTDRHLKRLFRECGFRTLRDLNRECFERWLTALVDRGASPRTRNCYRDDLVTFCNWCMDTGRLIGNSIAAIGKLNVEMDRRRTRRAMSEADLTRLLDVARRRPLLDAQTIRRGNRRGEAGAILRVGTVQKLDRLGRERALLYKVLVLTGLRKNELASLSVGQLELEGPVPFATLNAADEKNRKGSEIVLREDLATEIRAWLAEKLTVLQEQARRDRRPIPESLPLDTPLFTVPAGLLRILNRDLKAAGIAKQDERGRTLDVHALRTTFGTLLSKGGVAPRTAQAAMRHSDIRLTMNVYTDPKLLDVAGALDTLPGLPLDCGQGDTARVASATGSVDFQRRAVAPVVAPTADSSGQKRSIGSKSAVLAPSREGRGRDGVTSIPVNEKEPLTTAVSGSAVWALRGSNPRPHGCDPCALAN